VIKLFNRTKRPEPEILARWNRNEPCWCGSGKKYKQCHLAKDMPKK